MSNTTTFSYPRLLLSAISLRLQSLKERLLKKKNKSRSNNSDIDWVEELTFAQYISILAFIEGKEEIDNEADYKALAGICGIKYYHPVQLILDIKNLMDAIHFWIEHDKMLAEDMTPEEIAAGAQEVGKILGQAGIVINVAKEFGRDPDEVLQWRYKKVWGILKHNFVLRQYNDRLNKIYTDKNKKQEEVVPNRKHSVLY